MEKSIEDSRVIANYIAMPHHANPHGVMFGGVVMSWIDMAAAMVAEKHSGKDVVTIHVDEIKFLSPIFVGEHIFLDAKLISVGNTSMKISVDVKAKNIKTNMEKQTTQATVTFVAVDEKMKSSPVPKLK